METTTETCPVTDGSTSMEDGRYLISTLTSTTTSPEADKMEDKFTWTDSLSRDAETTTEIAKVEVTDGSTSMEDRPYSISTSTSMRPDNMEDKFSCTDSLIVRDMETTTEICEVADGSTSMEDRCYLISISTSTRPDNMEDKSSCTDSLIIRDMETTTEICEVADGSTSTEDRCYLISTSTSTRPDNMEDKFTWTDSLIVRDVETTTEIGEVADGSTSMEDQCYLISTFTSTRPDNMEDKFSCTDDLWIQNIGTVTEKVEVPKMEFASDIDSFMKNMSNMPQMEESNIEDDAPPLKVQKMTGVPRLGLSRRLGKFRKPLHQVNIRVQPEPCVARKPDKRNLDSDAEESDEEN